MKIEQIKKEDEKVILAGIVTMEFTLFETAIKQAERYSGDNSTAHSKKDA